MTLDEEKIKVTLTIRRDVAKEIYGAIENWLGRDADNDENIEYQTLLDSKVRSAKLTIGRAYLNNKAKG